MDDFTRHLNETLEADSEFKNWWETADLEAEIQEMVAELLAEDEMTQKSLADKIGMKASNLSRVLSGKTSPTVATLQRIAKGLGRKLEIRFVKP